MTEEEFANAMVKEVNNLYREYVEGWPLGCSMVITDISGRNAVSIEMSFGDFDLLPYTLKDLELSPGSMRVVYWSECLQKARMEVDCADQGEFLDNKIYREATEKVQALWRGQVLKEVCGEN